MTISIIPQYEKSIKYDRVTGDFCVTVNDECIGYTSTYTAGETLADDYVFEQVSRASAHVAQAQAVQVVAADLEAAAQVVGDTNTATAINKAAYHIGSGAQIIEARAGEYLIPSGTRGGMVHRASAVTCSCEAGRVGRVCWHRMAAHLLIVTKPAPRLVITSRYNADRCVHNVYVNGTFAGATWANWEIEQVAKAYIVRNATRGAAVAA